MTKNSPIPKTPILWRFQVGAAVVAACGFLCRPVPHADSSTLDLIVASVVAARCSRCPDSKANFSGLDMIGRSVAAGRHGRPSRSPPGEEFLGRCLATFVEHSAHSAEVERIAAADVLFLAQNKTNFLFCI